MVPQFDCPPRRANLQRQCCLAHTVLERSNEAAAELAAVSAEYDDAEGFTFRSLPDEPSPRKSLDY
jgi:hypothetical protein